MISPKQVVVVKEVQVPAPAPDPKTVVAAKTPGAEDKKSPAIDDKDLPPREGGKDGKEAKDGKDGKEGKDRSHRSSRGKQGHQEGGAGVVATTRRPPRRRPDRGAPASRPKGSLDDLLAGATKTQRRRRPSQGGRGQEGRGRRRRGRRTAREERARRGSERCSAKVQACYNQFKVPGTAMVTVVIAKSGKVTSSTVTGKFAGTPTGTCVEAAVKTASFPPSDGFTTPYPFQLK